MTDNTPNNASNKSPTHICYSVRESKNGKSYWTRIGVGWLHADEKGINAELACFPVDGRLSLRVASEKKN